MAKRDTLDRMYNLFDEAHRHAAQILEEVFPLGTQVIMYKGDSIERNGTVVGYVTRCTYGNSLSPRLSVRNTKTKKTKDYYLYQITVEGEE